MELLHLMPPAHIDHVGAFLCSHRIYEWATDRVDADFLHGYTARNQLVY